MPANVNCSMNMLCYHVKVLLQRQLFSGDRPVSFGTCCSSDDGTKISLNTIVCSASDLAINLRKNDFVPQLTVVNHLLEPR